MRRSPPRSTRRRGAFEVTTYDSAEKARDAVADRSEIGAITVGADGVTIVTASGAGTPYASLLTSIGSGLTSAGLQVAYDDVAPRTEDDPTGSAIALLGLPLVFGGNVSVILLITLFERHRVVRVVGGLLTAAVGGIATTYFLQEILHVVDGRFWLTAAALGLGIAAINVLLLALHNLFGMAGIGLGAVVLLFFANPLAGLATGPQWLPAPWGEIGQFLPIGAAGTAVRSAAFFDGAGAGTAFLVLGCWVLAGVVVASIAFRAKKAAPAVAA